MALRPHHLVLVDDCRGSQERRLGGCLSYHTVAREPQPPAGTVSGNDSDRGTLVGELFHFYGGSLFFCRTSRHEGKKLSYDSYESSTRSPTSRPTIGS